MAGNVGPIVGEEVFYKNTHKGVSRLDSCGRIFASPSNAEAWSRGWVLLS